MADEERDVSAGAAVRRQRYPLGPARAPRRLTANTGRSGQRRAQVAELGGRIAVEHEPPVGPPGQQRALAELRERARHGRALRRDEVREELVGEPDRDDAALPLLAVDAVAPALGDVPEQYEQADVDADELADREVQHERARAA